MRDSFGRNITYMRISVTEACNMACRYCSPGESTAENAGKEEEQAAGGKTAATVGKAGPQLTSGQIVEVCKAAESIGIRSFRFTGGEPLLRGDLCDILSAVREMPGTRDLTLTTNGLLLERQIESLVSAGLTGVNVSLDTLNPDHFREITGVDGLEQVKAGIRAALKFAGSRDDGKCTADSDLSGSEFGSGTGLRIHLNCVPQEGTTEEDILQLAELSIANPLSVRFIEMMPIG
ncbi:MAG: radical SAM protein, partial [Lachnospiraceae bacterium]|nr:radical SAM protein [Lachnospiraceae bacterium]